MVTPDRAREALHTIALQASASSDRGLAGLELWGESFIAAHIACPGGLSIEVGTRAGGSAYLFARLLELLYPEESHRPQLWTVDPYGNKPYDDGARCKGAPIYSDGVYGYAKRVLAGFDHHHHWYMTSADFFERIHGLTYWSIANAGVLYAANNVLTGEELLLPIGEERRASAASFILLDGDHSAAAIENEISAILWRGWLASGGFIVIDNIDADPATAQVLARCEARFERLRGSPESAVLKFLGAGVARPGHGTSGDRASP
jgi:hypothetical protein